MDTYIVSYSWSRRCILYQIGQLGISANYHLSHLDPLLSLSTFQMYTQTPLFLPALFILADGFVLVSFSALEQFQMPCPPC